MQLRESKKSVCSAEISISCRPRQAAWFKILSFYQRLCRGSETSLKSKVLPSVTFIVFLLWLCTYHPAVKVSNSLYNFPNSSEGGGGCNNDNSLCNLAKICPLLAPSSSRTFPVKTADRPGCWKRQTAHNGERSVGKLSQHSGRRAGALWWLPQHGQWNKHTTYTKSFTKEARLFQQLWHAACTPWLWNEQGLFTVWMEERLKIPDGGAFSSLS